MVEGKIRTKLLSSLSKVFVDEEPAEPIWNTGSMLKNEVYSFQVAYCWSGMSVKTVEVNVNSMLLQCIDVRKVDLVPSEMPCYADHDENLIRTNPGLYPDSLMPLNNYRLLLVPGQWRAIWITVNPQGNIKAGKYPIEIAFHEDSGQELEKAEFQLEILDALLPEQRLVHTEWFHTDCIATYYGIEVFSEEYWYRVEQFVCTASKHGINMILTPVFTPPLDTAVGGERPTVQLVDVKKTGNNFSFGFDKLKRWVDMCRRNGVQYFEISHLFTQWGAKHAPKIMATENGEYKRIFGWDTDAGGKEYASFLSQFLKELLAFVEQNDLKHSCYFHVSDEPKPEDFDAYKKARDLIWEYLKEYPMIDALSDYQFYEKGIVKNPIPATDHLDKFLENQVPDLWTYYCCGQYKQVANRFMNMSSARNRILGVQLYKFNMKGFLHWGYNFWYSNLSRHPIDPFRVTDMDFAVPSGDAFVVYPGKDGPIESLRLEVFYEALQDMRALELLESFVGKDAVLQLLEDGLEAPITFVRYPKDALWILTKREQINSKIVELVKKQH